MGDTVQEVENLAPTLLPVILKGLSIAFPQLAPLFAILGLAFNQVGGSAQALISHLDPAKPADPRLSA